MKRLIVLTIVFTIAMSLVAMESADTRIIQSSSRIKELAIESRSIQEPEKIVEVLEVMHKEFLIVLDANNEMNEQEVELTEARQEELDNALVELLDSIEVITITATQFKENKAVGNALDHFEAAMEKFGQ